MKSAPLPALAAVALFAVSTTVRGDGIVTRLPEDGSWTRYHVAMSSSAGGGREATGTLTVKSVGVASEGGRKCRWLEFEWQVESMGRREDLVFKVLVPESIFAEKESGKGPLAGMVRAWERRGMNEVKEVADDNARAKGLALFFNAPLKDREKIDERRTVSYQKGKLECKSGYRGRLELEPEPPAPAAGREQDSIFTAWPHEKVPFGTAACKLEVVQNKDGKEAARFELEFTLDDFGSGAESKLPDHE